MKYKVGDKVRVRSNLIVGKAYFMEDGKTRDSFVDSMRALCGNIVTIAGTSGGKYRIEECGHNWTDEMLEPVNNQKIVITTDGKETLARLYDGDKVVKSATAKCNPADTFDFAAGAKLAFERLTAEEKPQERYGFKVGDRVKAGDQETNCRVKGKVGTVIGFLIGQVAVEFDKNINGHTASMCGRAGKDGHCWFCLPGNLKLVEDEKFVPHILQKGEHLGNIGEPTNYKDAIGRPLRVGDTVEHFDDRCHPYGETFVANDGEKIFVMGIKCVCDDKTGSTGRWKIIKKRSAEEVADGEIVFNCKYVKSEK
jgi:hypothetical protein